MMGLPDYTTLPLLTSIPNDLDSCLVQLIQYLGIVCQKVSKEPNILWFPRSGWLLSRRSRLAADADCRMANCCMFTTVSLLCQVRMRPR